MVRPITVLIIALYNLSLFAGTAYLIIYDWSAWWFLLTVLVMGMYRRNKDD